MRTPGDQSLPSKCHQRELGHPRAGVGEEEANLGRVVAPVTKQDPKTSGDQPESA